MVIARQFGGDGEGCIRGATLGFSGCKGSVVLVPCGVCGQEGKQGGGKHNKGWRWRS